MGAISSTTERDVDRLAENNIRLSLDLWRWCGEANAAFIYASSAAVYGNGSLGFDDNCDVDSLRRLRPLNAYGWSKLFVDLRIAQDVQAGSAPIPSRWAGLRFFNVYGPHEYHKGNMRSVIHQIVPNICAGDPVHLYRSHNPNYQDGGQLRDFIHVDDCVNVINWLLNNHSANGIFNVGTGKARSFHDLALAAYAALAREPIIQYVDTPPEIRDGYQYFTEARMERLRRAGYAAPFIDLQEGIIDYIQNYLLGADPYR
jgi:ADP-L-glycero-D-manno-heptose 6-epimerase